MKSRDLADRVRVMTKKNKLLRGSRRHAAVERLSLFGNVTRLGPYGLISYAKWFSEAAGSTTAPADAPNFPLVRTFLAARAVELALKAFLALKGRSLLELADGPYGHDLIGLIREAEKLDLKAHVRLNAVQHAEIIKASEYYSEKVLEYPSLMEAGSAYSKMPHADILISAAEAFVKALYEPCRYASNDD